MFDEQETSTNIHTPRNEVRVGGYTGITLSARLFVDMRARLGKMISGAYNFGSFNLLPRGVFCLLDHNFLPRSDRAFILHMCIACDKTFHMVPFF